MTRIAPPLPPPTDVSRPEERLTTDALRRIAARASGLDERLTAYAPSAGHARSGRGGARVERWRKLAAGGDPQAFETLLRAREIDPGLVEGALDAEPRWAGPLPVWTDALRRLAASSGRGEAYLSRPDEQLFPFEDAFVGAVADEVDALRERTGPGIDLSVEAWRAFGRDLLGKFCELCARPLSARFAARRATRRMATWGRRTAARREGRTAYLAFVADLKADGIADLFTDYPHLARVLVATRDRWARAHAEMLARLGDDLPVLARTFKLGAGPPRVDGLRLGLSDPHEGGRSVAIVTFDTGAEVVYKPRGLRAEWAFGELIAWVNARGLEHPLRAPDVLRRNGYGWVGAVRSTPCRSDAEVARYYWRAGALMALAHVMCASDVHAGNIIAAGEHPYLIDLEVMMQAPHPAAGGRPRAQEHLRRSVLWTGMLPSRSDRGGIWDLDRSGLSGGEAGVVPLDRPLWLDVNTDAMRVESQPVVAEPCPNQPTLRGKRRPPGPYAADVAAGFEAAYRSVLKGRTAFLASDGPLTRFEGSEIRVLIRDTSLYSALRLKILSPTWLREGVDFDIEMEALYAAYRGSDVPPEVAIERESLRQLDIPAFRVRAANADDRWRPLAGYQAVGPEVVRERVTTLSEDDLALQRALVTASLAGHGNADPRLTGRVVVLDRDVATPHEAATRLGRELSEQALEVEEGWAWVALGRDQPALQSGLQFATDSLYDGRSGMGLFFAALVAAGEGSFRTAAYQSFGSLRAALHAGRPSSGPPLGVAGWGSAAYALSIASVLLDDAVLAADAVRLLDALDRSAVAEAAETDMVLGVAGTLLAALAAHDVTGAPGALDLAVACGARLMPERHRASARVRQSDGRGASHGVVGEAYALARLAARTNDGAFADAARELISAVPMEEATRPGRHTWCHGAPGIALALAATPCLRTEPLAEAALATTRGLGMLPLDHPCCGEMGIVEALLVAGHEPAARRRTDALLARSAGAGGFAFDTERRFAPAFFQGRAGIGYHLLRVAHPGLLPSVLAFHSLPLPRRPAAASTGASTTHARDSARHH